MKILLFSDSHNLTSNMKKAIEKEENVSIIIHLGDCVRDILKIKMKYPQFSYVYVNGNNDWLMDESSEKVIFFNNKKILISHGHLYSVKSGYGKLIKRGVEIGADAVFFGHTHKTEETYVDKMLLLNPGSVMLSDNLGIPSWCTIEVVDEKFKVKFNSIS